MKVSKALSSYLEREALEITSKHSQNQKRDVREPEETLCEPIYRSGWRPSDPQYYTRNKQTRFISSGTIESTTRQKAKRHIAPGLASKMLTDLKITWQAIADRDQIEDKNPFGGLSFKESKRKRLPYSRDWIASRWLQNGALHGKDPEAQALLLILIETGCRPSELLRLPVDRIRVNHAIPHIEIDNLEDDTNGRSTLKTDASRRMTPLVGVALPAAAALKTMGGVQRYWDRGNSFSAAVNKFLRDNGLQQDDRTVYNLRHAMIETLKNDRDCSDDLRRAIVGHAGAGSHERHYGEFSLQRKLEVLQRHTLHFDECLI